MRSSSNTCKDQNISLPSYPLPTSPSLYQTTSPSYPSPLPPPEKPAKKKRLTSSPDRHRICRVPIPDLTSRVLLPACSRRLPTGNVFHGRHFLVCGVWYERLLALRHLCCTEWDDGKASWQAQRRNFRALVLWNGGWIGLGWTDGMESGVKIVRRLVVMDGKAGSPLVWCYQSTLITEDRC
jgi:hypothetical protein